MKNHLYILSCLLLAANAPYCNAQVITTLAGTSAAGYSGDGGPATAAWLNKPFHIAIDATSNLYIADRNNNRIRKVSPAGIISTIAGTGVAAYSGDNGPATAAAINDITGVAIDMAGNIYIADRGNDRIRKVSTAGIITTVAGTGTTGYSGDGGSAASAKLNSPRDIAIDVSGNLYIADQGNNCIRKVDPAGIITTIAGTGTAGYNGDGIPATDAQLHGPYAIAADRAGNIWIADVDNQRIRKVNAIGMISTIAGTGITGSGGDGGLATIAQLNEPIALAADAAGRVYIADGWNHRIRMVDTSGIIITVAGTGTAGYSGDGSIAPLAMLDHPYGVAINNAGTLYIADNGNGRIRLVSPVDASDHSILIYPIPSGGTFTIYIPSANTTREHIIITDIAGRIVRDTTINCNTLVNMELEVPSGVYFIYTAQPAHRRQKITIKR